MIYIDNLWQKLDYDHKHLTQKNSNHMPHEVPK